MVERAFKPAPALARAPALTLPPDEAQAVAAAYQGAARILEYGSGGSTALAAAMPGKTVFSVESDAGWAQGLRDWFTAKPPQATRVVIHHADIGPTAKWGMPATNAKWQSYYLYPQSVWDLPDFVHPDVVLVDGRFRSACFMTVLFRITRPVVLLWDDYVVRPAYHAVERYVRPTQMHGRMARFDLAPRAMVNADLPFLLAQFAKVR